jgi:membrane-bound ClpP family serine protease
MELFGYDIESIYLFLLIAGVVLTVLYIFVGELIEGLMDIGGDAILNPITVIGYITLLGGLGYVLETMAFFIGSGIILLINLVVSAIVIVLVNYFIILPVKRSEKNMSYSINELKGAVGEVFTTIPENGFGEIIISRTHGTVSKAAKSSDHEVLPEGTKILVIDIDDEGVFLVSKHYE